MATVPISEFEHRVARWATELRKTREPLEISQRGRASLVVLDKQTFDDWTADRERLQAMEIKLLVDAGTRAFARGRSVTHTEVAKRLRRAKR